METAALPHTFERLVDLNGVSLGIDSHVMSPKMISVIEKQTYERHEARSLPKLLKKNDRVLELGGGVGFISSVIAKSEPQSLVVVEANPDLIPIIHANHQLNGVTATVLNCVAVTNPSTKSLPFYIAEDFWASSLSKPRSFRKVATVEAKLFSELLDEIRPTIIVMDIEGGELDLLTNSKITTADRVYVEIHPAVIGLAGVDRIFRSLSEQGFAYDAPGSIGGVVLFRKIPKPKQHKKDTPLRSFRKRIKKAVRNAFSRQA